MKTIPPPSPEPESGQKYWRSLDHLADAPEFRQWLEREFPAGASEFTDPVGRRHFIKIMSASFLLAGLGVTGCRRPEERILPFSKQPEGYTHGVPRFYATAMPIRGTAIPLIVRAHEGRPTKIEGNPDHPDSNGSTDTFAQASILNLYDPDRAQRFTRAGNEISRDVAMDVLSAVAVEAAKDGGAGLCFLMGQSSSPSRARLQALLSQKFPGARWFVYEPVDLEAGSTALSGADAAPVVAYHRLDQAKVVLSLDCDFIGAEEDTYRHCRNFSKGRRIAKPGDPMNRLYAVEALMTLTGMNADHRLRVPTSAVLAVAAAVAAQVAPDNVALQTLAKRIPLPAGVNPKWVQECAADLLANKGASLVCAGHRQPDAVHVAAHLINTALGNVGKTVLLREGTKPSGNISQLAELLGRNQVKTLVILGGNPVYNAPANLDWADVQARAGTVIRLGYYEDETFAGSTVHLPEAHYLESWGDARTSDGTLVPVQPLIAPLFGGLTDLEVLARLGGLAPLKPYDIVRETFAVLAGPDPLDDKWKKFLHDGYLAGSAFRPIEPKFAPERVAAVLGAAPLVGAPTKEKLELVFHRDYRLDDGRYSNNGWLQELPDPVTKVVWDGLVLMSRTTAEAFGLKNQDVVELELNQRKVAGPVWIQPGMADFSVGLALGYGRQKGAKGGIGRVGDKVGLYNAYQARTAGAPHFAVGAALSKTGQVYKIASTQEHGSMEGRPIVREATLKQFTENPGFAKNMDLEGHMKHTPKDPKTGEPLMIYEHPYKAYEARKSQVGVDLSGLVIKSKIHQWGMSIDLNSCVGCSACVVACQSENNIPIVGKEQVSRNRSMHWIRIDRYFSGSYEKASAELVDDPQVVTQPMLCQHCENAPCESVCPVNATLHDEEGLNLMAYNRCVGTRYCSNNCPYKVRRFNFFDYNRHSLNELYKSPLTSSSDGTWNLVKWWNNPKTFHTVPEDQWQLIQLVKNPDVSVRMRGVMEKCTFCVQRIQSAEIAQKVKAGASGDVQVPDGTIKTACQQACPAEAIVFGNLLDPKSRVSELKRQERDYSVLGFLDTRPRLTYLARVRNPNPKMPDYYETPLNIKEYEDKQGGGEGHPEAHEGAPEGPGTHGTTRPAALKGKA